ncbi:MFS transporter [Acinetobacter bouvetii]|nr:MFS transporter [Acinetobacter bouvetii]
MNFNNMFLSLRYHNFRNYFIGHALSTLGTWIQQVSLAWIIYELTNSTALLGIIGFCALIPQLFVSPFAGAWIDKIDKRKTLIFIQILLFSQAILLGIAYHFHWLTPSILIGLSLLLGILSAIDTPLRQSLLSLIIEEKTALPNALALNAMVFNASRFVGPPIAGLLLATIGAELCFYLNGLSYLILAIAVLCMKQVKSSIAQGNMKNVLKEGFEYVYQHSVFKYLMLTVFVLNMTASSYVALLPVYAKDILLGDEKTLGILWGAAGIGSLLSSMLLAGQKNFNRVYAQILLNILFCGAGLLLLALSSSYMLLMLAMFLLGFGISTSNISTNIILQQDAPESLRGRVVSIYTSTRFGFDALGGLCAGLLASLIAPQNVMLIFALILLAYALFNWLQIYPRIKKAPH